MTVALGEVVVDCPAVRIRLFREAGFPVGLRAPARIRVRLPSLSLVGSPVFRNFSLGVGEPGQGGRAVALTSG